MQRMQHTLRPLTGLLWLVLCLMVGCETSDDDLEEVVDLEGEDGNLLADTNNSFGEAYDQSYNNIYDNSDVGENLDDSMSEDTVEGNQYANYTDMASNSTSMGSGEVYFVTSDVAVVDSMDGAGNTVFMLSQGDTIKAEIAGDYATIGLGHYVPASMLSQTLVERPVTTNSWR